MNILVSIQSNESNLIARTSLLYLHLGILISRLNKHQNLTLIQAQNFLLKGCADIVYHKGQ